jgi:hypothetical protein
MSDHRVRVSVACASRRRAAATEHARGRCPDLRRVLDPAQDESCATSPLRHPDLSSASPDCTVTTCMPPSIPRGAHPSEHPPFVRGGLGGA